MSDEKEILIRETISSIRKLRRELNELDGKRKRLEQLSEKFYVFYLDNLWEECNIKVLEVYNQTIDKIKTLADMQTMLLRMRVVEEK
jgi:hypothetical protein